MQPPPRIVTLVLVDARGVVLGQLPSFPAATPWWQDAGPVLVGARARFGIDVMVLRLLETELPMAHGGSVTYLAEADPAAVVAAGPGLGLQTWHGTFNDDPLRLSYAKPGGPTADILWADGILAGLGRSRSGRPEQVRTWNLSSLWRLPLTDGAAWLKVVPPFFAHEGVILERLRGERVPQLLGREGTRILMREIPGDDRYDAPLSELRDMVGLLVDLQLRGIGRAEELEGMGLPDWRSTALAVDIAEVIRRDAGAVNADDRSVLDEFVGNLPRRMESVAACGLPDTLIHGDFHPGNVRRGDGPLMLLDWSDSGVGHPFLDQPTFLTRIPQRHVAEIRSQWHLMWRRGVAGSDPKRAARLLAPIAAARQAVIYRRFLDNIEASEQVYHRADVPDWLERTAAILRTEHLARS